MKNFIITISLLLIFALDCITGVVLKEPIHPTCEGLTSNDALFAQAMEVWGDNMIQFCTQKSIVFIFYPFILILGYCLARFYKATLDLADIFMTALVTLTGVITYVDWKVNANTRETETDWQVFGTLFIVIIILKIAYYVAINRRKFTR